MTYYNTIISSPRFDICRNWIKRARDNKWDWEQIEAGNYIHDDNKEFIRRKIEEDFWPFEIFEDIGIWTSLVQSEKDSEENSKSLSIMEAAAEIHDKSEDNAVSVPLRTKSSWQLYRSHLKMQGWNMDSLNELERATLATLKKLSTDTRETGPKKGLVVGHVQSGKTANMAALMAMAADHGWNFFVILSGTVENLRIQTQNRLLKDLKHPGNVEWIMEQHLKKGINSSNAGLNVLFHEGSALRFFTVCLKNSKRLSNLIEWMQYDPNKYRKMKIIIIDDEADQASINTLNVESGERAKINSLIVNLVEGKKPDGSVCQAKPQAVNYISYTATPYANFLNESTNDSLYPRNFIRALQASNEYFGPKQIFGIEEEESCEGLDVIREINKDEVMSIKKIQSGEVFSGLPKSFIDSICWFLCVTAAMRTLGYKKPISMLIHTSQNQEHHSLISEAIAHFVMYEKDLIMQVCDNLWTSESKRFTKSNLRMTFPEYGRKNEDIWDYPDFLRIKEEIGNLIQAVTNIPLNEEGDLMYHDNIHLCIDNCANNNLNEDGMYVRLAYPEPTSKNYPEVAPAFIVVGGNTLSRGLTIEGLVSTFFLRSTCQADTLMQMGRWFGYRRNYELFQRIWMTDDTKRKFLFLTRIEWELRADLKRFEALNADPLEFGPRVKNSPKLSWLRITSKNKMQSATEIDVDYTGSRNQTVSFHDDYETLHNNKMMAEHFIEKLGDAEVSVFQNSYVWRNVNYEIIRDELLDKMVFHKRATMFNNIALLSEWIDQLKEKNSIMNWNVVLAGVGKAGDPGLNNPWEIGDIRIGKVQRSRKTMKRMEHINIGVLRAPRDLLADIFVSNPEEISNFEKFNRTEMVDVIRDEKGLAGVPQLIIYCIDKDSKARNSTNLKGSERQDLDAPEDIIGLCISIPGDKTIGSKGALTIKLNDRIEESVAENIEEDYE